MEHYVYIIKSLQDGSYYKGYTMRPQLRLEEHNERLSKYTSLKCPWILVYLEKFVSKREALKREKQLKKYSHDQIERLTGSAKNLL